MGKPSPELVQAVAQQATAAGIDPATLMAVIGYETGGTYNPNTWGGKGGNYFGLIQFGPNERSTYGVYQGMPVDRQVGAAISFLLDRGFDPSRHGLLDMYSTINAGSPGHYGRSDGNGTVRSHAANIEAQYLPAAQRYVQDAAPSRAYAGLPDGRANMAPLRGLDEVRAPPIPVPNPSRMAYVDAPARSALEGVFAPLLDAGVERTGLGRLGHWADALARPPASVPYQPGTVPMGRPAASVIQGIADRFPYPARNVVPYVPNPPAPSAAQTQRMARDTAGSLPAKEGISRTDFNGRYFGNAPLLNPDRSRMPNIPERTPIPLEQINILPPITRQAFNDRWSAPAASTGWRDTRPSTAAPFQAKPIGPEYTTRTVRQMIPLTEPQKIAGLGKKEAPAKAQQAYRTVTQQVPVPRAAPRSTPAAAPAAPGRPSGLFGIGGGRTTPAGVAYTGQPGGSTSYTTPAGVDWSINTGAPTGAYVGLDPHEYGQANNQAVSSGSGLAAAVASFFGRA